jgi:hypothetical protein
MSADTNQGGALGRGRMTNTQRIELLEHDREAQSRVLTALVESGKAFTPEQIAQLRAVMVDVLGDAGLRLDQAEHEDEARRDFMFLRSLRKGVNGTAAKIGWLVIAAVCGAVIWLVNSGLNVWRAG